MDERDKENEPRIPYTCKVHTTNTYSHGSRVPMPSSHAQHLIDKRLPELAKRDCIIIYIYITLTYLWSFEISPRSAIYKYSSRRIYTSTFLRETDQQSRYRKTDDVVRFVCFRLTQAPTLEEQVAELLSACCGPSETHNGFANSRLRIDKDNMDRPVDEATRVHMRTWSEFASWQHLDNEGPYWWRVTPPLAHQRHLSSSSSSSFA